MGGPLRFEGAIRPGWPLSVLLGIGCPERRPHMSACAELVEKHVGRSPLGDLDHYTIIVENAEEVANFHREVLGFTLLEVRPLNTGTAPSCLRPRSGSVSDRSSDKEMIC